MVGKGFIAVPAKDNVGHVIRIIAATYNLKIYKVVENAIRDKYPEFCDKLLTDEPKSEEEEPLVEE